jgi:cell shape-determining protein MreC
VSQLKKIGQLNTEIEVAKKVSSELKEKSSECSKLKQQNSNLEKKMLEKNKELDAFKKVFQ